MTYATISADVVRSTSLSKEMLQELIARIKERLARIETCTQGFWGRLVRGDSIECVMSSPRDALRVALVLKCLVKGFGSTLPKDNAELKACGLRLAIGIGGMRIVNRELDIMDGEAIYLSGRTLDAIGRKKNDMFKIAFAEEADKGEFSVIFGLLNQIITKATGRQCEILCERLQSGNDEEAAQRLNISRSGVNQALSALGWDVIERAISYYENTITKYYV